MSETAGNIGPVTFKLGRKKLQPFAIAPWAEEKTAASPPAVVRGLRGDFFCMPFGINSTPFKGERHPLHGETANRPWKLESAGAGKLHLSLTTEVRTGRVDKYISLKPGETAIYQRHVISKMSGAMSLGHHATLNFPNYPGSGRISTSRFLHGEVVPSPLEDPASGGYSCLRVGAQTRSLTRVPLANGGYTDLSIYPARRGFEDLFLLVSDDTQTFGWTSVTFPAEGYLWFALKDPRVLRQTILWVSNGGRHYAPWNGRHFDVLGLEEVTSFFHFGLAESATTNSLSAKGYTTCHLLNPKRPLTINYIMAVAAIPKSFDRLLKIAPMPGGQSVRLISKNGAELVVPIDLNFLSSTTK